jgi:pilus assembly protein TadC
MKFDSVIRNAGYYRRRLSIIYGLLSFTFLLAGMVAFYFDNVTLPGRIGMAEFSGKYAHGVGVASFFVAAYWIYQSLKEYRVSLPVLLSPFAAAAAVSAISLAIKYG